MIYHLSIPARNPKQVSLAIADLFGERSTIHPFVISQKSYIILSNTEPKIGIEVYPETKALKPGDGPNASVQVIDQPVNDLYYGGHAAINSPLRVEEVKTIAKKFGWKAVFCQRDNDFNLVEFWLENRFLLEIITPPHVSGNMNAHLSSYWGKSIKDELRNEINMTL